MDNKLRASKAAVICYAFGDERHAANAAKED